MSSPHPNASYTLAWICALPEEYDVAIAILDEIHGLPQHQPLEDKNAYLLGRIGAHNVVMVCLPAGRMGTTAAAIVAENLCQTFRSVKYGFIVGIGGGVPGSGRDIRLGDVVVSVPGGGYGGVVQYDYGKVGGDGKYIHREHINAPPGKLLANVTLLGCLSRRKNVGDQGNMTANILASLGEKYAYPAGLRDRLFCSDYSHSSIPGYTGCEACNPVGEIFRRLRTSDLPVVHLGTIASGDSLIINAELRDRVNGEYGRSILCFECGSAGVMNILPCLVVKGIAGYADSHRYDAWRPRAIAAACSYAKALILQIPPEEVPQQKDFVHVTDLIKNLRDELGQIKAAIDGLWSLQKDNAYTKSYTDHCLTTVRSRSVSIMTSLTSRLAFTYYGLMHASQYVSHRMSFFVDSMKRYICSKLPGYPSRDAKAGPSAGALPSVLSFQGWGWHLIAEPHMWMSS
ncbi:Pfs, NACHT and ankyrin domain protein [Aspergillus eucalypticola CBS 122712]|uniref:Pfs, NACHT and ankyrin domain protein n=1 Tax=Aspergillus eucalypticola (strain CBS 122712 / IBT 29274) TaxID=1448314 RepID=A0A317WIP1_ASPEC|nr:Pfs, NACHT and ankyrin domain protein [Aspergillus eucalypticola CBS 122712]PWY85521.1 Pfs, NACHT and ankyrin domain protein [Aspergillus eucalypticola CBS 122712]